jgi:hypothetical protein
MYHSDIGVCLGTRNSFTRTPRMPFAPWKMSADHEVHPAVLFLHISKCGGTTLQKSQALQEFLGLQLCVCLGDARRYGLASGKEQCILQLNNYQCSLYLHEEGLGKLLIFNGGLTGRAYS